MRDRDRLILKRKMRRQGVARKGKVGVGKAAATRKCVEEKMFGGILIDLSAICRSPHVTVQQDGLRRLLNGG